MSLPALNAMFIEFMEPWQLGDGEQAGEVLNAAGVTIVDPMGSTLDIADEARYMRRICACINACAGISTEDLEAHLVFDQRVRRGSANGMRSSGGVH